MPTDFERVITLTSIAAGLLYLRGWWLLRNSLPCAVSTWRAGAFIAGLFSLWTAVASPFAALDHRFLTAHMTRHLLLMTVAAPLLLLGAPAVTLFHGLPQFVLRSVLVPSLRSGLARVLRRIFAHPAFCWFAGTTAVIGWHVPFLFELGMRSASWHAFEDLCFLTGGLLFWWPVVRPWPSVATMPRWGVPMYLFLATLPCDALSAFLTFCGRVVYPHYASAHWSVSVSSLADQERAGALMWVWVTFICLIPAAVVTLELLSPQVRAVDREVV